VEHTNRQFVLEVFDPEQIFARATQEAQGEPFCFMTMRQPNLPLCAALNSRIKNNSFLSDTSVLRNSSNKVAMRRKLRGSSYTCEFYEINNENDVRESWRKFEQFGQADVVMKPASGYASIGVKRSRSLVEALEHFDQIKQTSLELGRAALSTGQRNEDKNAAILMEPYLDGEEFCVDLVVGENDALAVNACSKSPMKAPWFEEVTYISPAICSADERQRLEQAALSVVRSLEIRNTAVHVELRFSGTTPIVLDVGLRIGGSGLSHDLVYFSTGYDFFGEQLRLALGKSVRGPDSTSLTRQVLLYLVQVEGGGRVQGFPEVPQEILSRFEVVRKQWFVGEGDVVVPYPNYSGHPGYVLLRSAERTMSREEIEESVAILKKKFRMEYRS
jgi:predicted ATP-grasp superfamily ATP-dependent carboligase